MENTEEICISMCREYNLNEKQEEAVVALINSIKYGIVVTKHFKIEFAIFRI